ncbi:MAG: response regulator [Flavicella sp.]
MKILAIDDQQLVLMSIDKYLSSLGFEVKSATNARKGLALVASFNPDLIIVDVNMEGVSGLEFVQDLRFQKKIDIPVVVMSGNTSQKCIVKAFDLGVQDYIKKPVSLDELSARVVNIIGLPKGKAHLNVKKSDTPKLISKNCVGIVIPCYNEANRLVSPSFIKFIESNLGYHLCFVNDGSTDETATVLEKLKKGRESNISVIHLKNNMGKASAVRKGMLTLIEDSQLDYIGYLDADLSTDFLDFEELVNTITTKNYKIVSGSRIERIGAQISKDSLRSFASFVVNCCIQRLLGMKFKDTQCGAKIIDKSVVRSLFARPFVSKWLFDVELFKRMQNQYGKMNTSLMICEVPLKRWIHRRDSKLTPCDCFKIFFQLIRIASHYKVESKMVV